MLAKDLKERASLFKVETHTLPSDQLMVRGLHRFRSPNRNTRHLLGERRTSAQRLRPVGQTVRMHNVVEVQRAAGDERKKLWVRFNPDSVENRHDQEEVYAQTTY